MRKFLSRFLPTHEAVKSQRWLKPFGSLLQHPNLWHLHRRTVASSVAIGLFCGLIPGPLQMISAALLAVLLRVNLPVALITTLYTNPFTIVPLYVLAFQIGTLLTGARSGVAVLPPSLPELHWHNLLYEMWDWVALLGKPLLVGLPVLAVGLAIIGYVVVRVAWRVVVIWKWRARHRHRTA